MITSRRELLSSTICGLIAAVPALALSQNQEMPPPLKAELVREFVIAAHGNLEKVKTLLNDNPQLLNATWDWQNGDFESAIGAASHVGNRDIALYLIENGARTDLFTHTMLGHTEIVRQTLSVYPAMINCKGPHGISLIRHAEKGGESAKEVLDFLKSIKS